MTKKLRRQQPRRSLLETFLQLCSMTTPHGCESFCWPCLPHGKGIDWLIDMNNNVHIYVPLVLNGKKTDSRIMWTCHLDTADHSPQHVTFIRSKEKQTGDEIIETDGHTILGADCKMGAAIMIKMIEHGIPGWYAFYAGEEVGRIGSDALAKRIVKQIDEKRFDTCLPDICISLDRMNLGDVITRQSGRDTCSPTFALALASIFNKHPELHYRPCPNGSYTDSYSFCGIIPECTNISVGYSHQHTRWEEQNITHAQRLLDTILEHHELFELLPVDRDPSAKVVTGHPYSQHNYSGHNYLKPVEAQSSDPTKSTDQQSSGGTGTHALVLHTQSGLNSGISSGGKAKGVTSSSQPESFGLTKAMTYSHTKARKMIKMTKAQKKRAKRQRRTAIKLKQSANTCKSGTPCPPKNDEQLLPLVPMDASMEQTNYPFVMKTEDEVKQTILERPYLGFLAAVKQTEVWHPPSKPLDKGENNYPHWMRETWEFDAENAEKEEDQASASGSTSSADSESYDEILFDEMLMKYEKGELDEEEEELFLLHHIKELKRGNTRGHHHGTVIAWYECAGCGLFAKCEVLDGYPPDDVKCEGCGDPIERTLMRYDGDCEMYVPITGDMSCFLDPDTVDEGRGTTDTTDTNVVTEDQGE